ncbi:GTP-binding protein [Malassezia psittaci]|uniref:GTP-binding protein n=1 Tax=Malassezia psittaci TaxID=1821823 RepID=A0AAF0F769_9BASI|nr:GTP-binding protein [Malassezia psittaci]
MHGHRPSLLLLVLTLRLELLKLTGNASSSKFKDIRNWYKDVEQHASEGVRKILVGNKCDWEEKRAVTKEQAEELAKELGISYVETSAKSSTNVDEAFFKLAQQVKDHLVDQGIISNVPGTSGSQNLSGQSGMTSFGIGSGANKQGGCC